MRKVCFLSMNDLGDYVADDELAIEPLNELGWDVETVSWKASQNWSEFESVIIRTPWDYHKTPSEFLDALRKIESQTLLLNPLKLIKWNIEKTYLAEIEKQGINIVPTIFGSDDIDQRLTESWFDLLDSKEVILKPTISATAKDTFRVNSFPEEAAQLFRGRKYMVQPFMKNIAAEGEFSLFYFGGDFSHAILKTPAAGDFRVQEDFGGKNVLINAGESLLEFGQSVLDLVKPDPLYSRVDFVRNENDEFALMELELIEPSLYFRMDKDSPKRFAKAFNDRMNEL